MSSRDRIQLNLPIQESSISIGSGATVRRSILLVTKDASIGPVLARALEDAGYGVFELTDARAALDHLKKDPLPALVLLDIELPDMRGTELCRVIRSQQRTNSIPVIVVTACDTETDRIVSFELGADDFVGAPFSVREVLLRVRLHLRSNPLERSQDAMIEVGSLRLNREAHRVWVSDREISLSVREFRLLQALMERSERVLSRHMLLEAVWGTTANVGVRAVDAFVTRLRRKLGDARDCVETVSSVGYRLKRPG